MPYRSTAKSKATAPIPQGGMDATLRTGTAGSQDESPCRAIHRFKGNGRCKGNGKFNDNGNAMLLWRNRPAQPEGCATKTGMDDAVSEERSFASLRMTA
jgi:hypothetical protein